MLEFVVRLLSTWSACVTRFGNEIGACARPYVMVTTTTTTAMATTTITIILHCVMRRPP